MLLLASSIVSSVFLRGQRLFQRAASVSAGSVFPASSVYLSGQRLPGQQRLRQRAASSWPAASSSTGSVCFSGQRLFPRAASSRPAASTSAGSVFLASSAYVSGQRLPGQQRLPPRAASVSAGSVCFSGQRLPGQQRLCQRAASSWPAASSSTGSVFLRGQHLFQWTASSWPAAPTSAGSVFLTSSVFLHGQRLFQRAASCWPAASSSAGSVCFIGSTSPDTSYKMGCAGSTAHGEALNQEAVADQPDTSFPQYTIIVANSGTTKLETSIQKIGMLAHLYNVKAFKGKPWKVYLVRTAAAGGNPEGLIKLLESGGGDPTTSALSNVQGQIQYIIIRGDKMVEFMADRGGDFNAARQAAEELWTPEHTLAPIEEFTGLSQISISPSKPPKESLQKYSVFAEGKASAKKQSRIAE
ncbi:uncharacterized protein LOC129588750 [Paramacrobiotus metropolitanus]|uniref:uncharacterized protein LOC129588750 n=1 Tax=Paramacrobiotus metropolitanus TaxID=2943436 RepID=UPI0024460D46|nr:uncharacterized protein LOC129588750 [Paramacrobiotus metropolitanus]